MPATGQLRARPDARSYPIQGALVFRGVAGSLLTICRRQIIKVTVRHRVKIRAWPSGARLTPHPLTVPAPAV